VRGFYIKQKNRKLSEKKVAAVLNVQNFYGQNGTEKKHSGKLAGRVA
jgi:hypothetical protein